MVSFSLGHIHVEVKDWHLGTSRFLTGFYGNPNARMRIHSWNLLHRVAPLSELPWLVFGNFDEVLHVDEVKGKRQRNPVHMQQF